MKMNLVDCQTCPSAFTTLEEHRTICNNCIADHKLKPFAYLPGRYANKCTACKKEFEGAKGSQLCRKCAVKAYNKQPKAKKK